MNGNDAKILGFICDRLERVHGESPNTDYMIHLRRIAGNGHQVKTRGRSIDVGCGGGPKRPAKGFDAYCDVLDPSVVTARPYWQCRMEDMSCFGDKEFDYARCHHVIEHVDDPDHSCRELIRIARAGLISFPPPQAEIMFGRRDHNWFVFVDRGRLLFVKKRHGSYGVPRAVTRCELNVDFPWEGSFEWQVVV